MGNKSSILCINDKKESYKIRKMDWIVRNSRFVTPIY